MPVLGGRQLVIPASQEEREAGSLWRERVSANYQFADDRARFPGDLLTIVVFEDSAANKSASTDTEHESEVFGNLEQFFGFPQQVAEKNFGFDPEALLKARASREWVGAGTTERKGRMKARVTVEVKAVSPNGNLFVQGDKVVAVNNEDQYMVLSGWVRPDDINARNEIESSRLGSARIDYYGVGPLGRQQRASWGLFLMDYIWPF